MEQSKLTRRAAICACLSAVGGVAVGQNSFKSEGDITFANSSLGIFIDLNTITYLEVQRGKETLRITNDEIWKALHVD